MTTDVPIVEQDATIEQCIHLIDQHKTRYLLSFADDETLAGIITIHDLLRQVLSDNSLAQRLLDEDEGDGKIY